MSVSVDGYMERPNREIDWQVVDDELLNHMVGWLARIGGFLEGRVTYELMADYWPAADQDPAAAPTAVDFAQIWRDMPKVVYSRTLERAGWNATVPHDVVPTEVLALKTAARWRPRRRRRRPGRGVRPPRPDRRVPALRPPRGDRAWQADAAAVGREGPVEAGRDPHLRQWRRHAAL